jgi:hypothetical protein
VESDKGLIFMSEKPTISERDYNWTAHLAGLRAEAKAKQEGGVDPAASAALLDAGQGKVTIAGHAFPPVTAGFILLLPMLNKVAANSEVLSSESGTVMMMAWALAYPQQAWEATKAAKREGNAENLAEAIFAFASGFALDSLRDVAAWVTKELERLKDDAEEAELPGKPGAMASGSTPTPPASSESPTAPTAGS